MQGELTRKASKSPDALFVSRAASLGCWRERRHRVGMGCTTVAMQRALKNHINVRPDLAVHAHLHESGSRRWAIWLCRLFAVCR